MDFEVTSDGMFAIKNVSKVLDETDILDLARDNFAEELKDGEEYFVLQVTDVEDDHMTNWFLVPRSLMEKQKKTLK